MTVRNVSGINISIISDNNKFRPEYAIVLNVAAKKIPLCCGIFLNYSEALLSSFCALKASKSNVSVNLNVFSSGFRCCVGIR